MVHCKFCRDEDINNFISNNKSVCKSCIAYRLKAQRKTMRYDDLKAREFCINAGIDFETVCGKRRERMLLKERASLNQSINEPDPEIVVKRNALISKVKTMAPEELDKLATQLDIAM